MVAVVLSALSRVLPLASKNRVLITGGTGFIGKNLLLGNGHVWVMARNKPKEHHDRFIQADVRDYAFKKGEFSHIIHAAEVGPEATQRVVDSGACTLLISSGAAYYPGTPYANAKIASEKVVKDHGGTICRLFTFMGPYLPFDGSYAAGNFIRDALFTGTVRIKGDGKAVRSYMHTSDMSKCVWNVLRHGEPGETYDIGAKTGITMLGLAEEIARQAGHKTGRRIDVEVDCGQPSSLAPYTYLPLDPENCPDLSIGLKLTISKTLDWAIENVL